MKKLIVAFGNEINRSRIAEILETGGYSPLTLCRSGKEAIRAAAGNACVVICACKLADMMADELAYDIGEGSTVIAVGKPAMLEMCECDGLFRLPTPLKKQDLFNSLELLSSLERGKSAVGEIKDGGKEIVSSAKAALMEKCGMTEPEAHRFIQKKSMDAGLKMAAAARIIENFYC